MSAPGEHGDQASSRDLLYAEWLAFDMARAIRMTEEEAEPAAAVGTPTMTVEPVSGSLPGFIGEVNEGAPRASQESGKPMCRCRARKVEEPTIPGPSGRRFAIRQTKAGNTYGHRHGVVLVVNGRHAIERSNVGFDREAVVDRVTAKLETRAKAIENARAVVPSSEWPKLDALLVRWFKRPGTWRGTRERIGRCIRYMNLSDDVERQAMKALNTMALRGTWAT